MDINELINFTPTETEKLQYIKDYVNLFNSASNCIGNIIKGENINMNRINACKNYNKIISCLDPINYLLLDAKPVIEKNIYIDSYFNLGTLIKDITQELINNKQIELNKNNSNRTNNISLTLSDTEQMLFNKSLNCFFSILKIDFENKNAIKQIISIYTTLIVFSQNDLDKSLNYLQQVLLVSPNNPIIHYNLGFIYQRLNNLALSMIHYKLSAHITQPNIEIIATELTGTLLETQRLVVNNYNGIASIYRSLKQWPECLYFLLKAEKILPDDPDVNNQLGVAYTEMRRTDLGEICYLKAIENYTKTFISTDSTFLLSELYLNYGHLLSSNGDNFKSIDFYNKSLKVCPKFHLPFQNKIMNLIYIFDQLKDKMYITEQHKIINKLYLPLKSDKNYTKFIFDKNWWNKDTKINIGIVSGDFVDHPVSFFISTFLKNYNTTLFNVTCYSECIIETKYFNENIQFKLIKGMNAHQVAKNIYQDHIHILLDLAGHTAFNRLDVFSLKPSPIQITYIGYPITTGLNEMDYRITDNICDGDLSISQKFYTEKLLPLKNCFLCYDPYLITRNKNDFVYPPLITKKFNNLTIGCFNRLVKITDPVIELFNKLLVTHSFVKFVFKTKALLNPVIKQQFLDKFDVFVQNRITILDCKLTHQQHLETYNQVNIAIDTFPYSGTTTSCESLFMGVPVLSMYDSTHYFHPMNVTCSLLENSGMKEYIFNNENELNEKIIDLQNKPESFWKNIKEKTRKQFLSNKVCDKELHLKNIQELFTELYNKHKSILH